MFFKRNKKLLSKSIRFLSFLLILSQFSFSFSKSESSSEDLLIIETPKGPYFPSDQVNFSCISKILGNSNNATLDWEFQTDDLQYVKIQVESSLDMFIRTKESLNKTSLITIPSHKVIGITCRWNSNGNKAKRTVPIEVQSKDGIHSDVIIDFKPCSYLGPDVFIITNSDVQNVTNSSIHLPVSQKSFTLVCLHNMKDPFEWKVSKTNEKDKPNPTTVLNFLGLINRQGIKTGRLQSQNCGMKSFLEKLSISEELKRSFCKNGTNFQMEILEIMVPPIASSTSTMYTCQSETDETVKTDVTINTPQVKSIQNEQDKEFMDLVNLLMQILQSSSNDSGSSSNGPLYGVGFGSSTIMILMALTIYYLKRQLKQIQGRVEEGDRLRKRSRAIIHEDDEDNL